MCVSVWADVLNIAQVEKKCQYLVVVCLGLRILCVVYWGSIPTTWYPNPPNMALGVSLIKRHQAYESILYQLFRFRKASQWFSDGRFPIAQFVLPCSSGSPDPAWNDI